MVKDWKRLLRPADPERILRGGAANLAGLILRTFSGLGVYLLIARAFSPAALGQYVLLAACITLPGGLSLLGLNHALSRFVQEQTGRGSAAGARAVYLRIRTQALLFSLAAAGLVFVNAGAVAEIFGRSAVTSGQVRFAALFIPLFALMTLNRGLLRAHHHSTAYAWFHFLPNLLCGLVLAAALLFFNPLGAAGLPIQAFAAGVGVSALISLWLVHHILPRKDGGRVNELPRMGTVLRVSIPLFLLYLMHTLFTDMEILLLGHWANDTAIATYSLALKIAAFSGFIHTSLSVPLVPKIAEKHFQGRLAELETMYNCTRRRMLNLTLVLGAALVLAAPLILHVFGKGFHGAWLPLALLVITQVIFAATGPVANYLTMTGHEKACTVILGSSLAGMVMLQLLLIPLLGILGAALAHLAGFAVQRLLLETYRRRITPGA